MSRVATRAALRLAIGQRVAHAEVLRDENRLDWVSLEFGSPRYLAAPSDPEDWAHRVSRAREIEILSQCLPWRMRINGAVLVGAQHGEGRLTRMIARLLGKRLLSARVRLDGGLDLLFPEAHLRFGPWPNPDPESGVGWSVWRHPSWPARVSELSLVATYHLWGHA